MICDVIYDMIYHMMYDTMYDKISEGAPRGQTLLLLLDPEPLFQLLRLAGKLRQPMKSEPPNPNWSPRSSVQKHVRLTKVD